MATAPKIVFPKFLEHLLTNGNDSLFSPVRDFANKIEPILADNTMSFFPDYTDHGITHINQVLEQEVKLIPEETQKANVLTEHDAALLIVSTFLHDIAMHIFPEGFLQLVGQDSPFKPLPWFDEDHEGHAADRPWHDLWIDYTSEIRRSSEGKLSLIIGEEAARVWKFEKLPDKSSDWTKNHYLVIGEFLRRHHARLAHEIAIYGFPIFPGRSGFPALGQDTQNSLCPLADLIGLTARSHGMSLRVCKAYLDHKHPGLPKPEGASPLYSMALLRVADYLQIDKKRAPAVLLQLKNPQSPLSIQEWNKHQVIRKIDPHTDPSALHITVDDKTADGKPLSLQTYLQVRELLENLQTEMDHASAVLSECYARYTNEGMHHLTLKYLRIKSNPLEPEFQKKLPYIPKKTEFSTDPRLLTLLVKPLYGDYPEVGVRELVQNAADAVRELKTWCSNHNTKPESLDLPEIAADVVVEFIDQNDRVLLRVQDCGIGMTADTIQNYFLKAGASFRHSDEWLKEFTDDTGHSKVARAGKFGIGAFAIFLLGRKYRLQTRHASETTGFELEASMDSQLIEIKRFPGKIPVGTTVEIEIDRKLLPHKITEKSTFPYTQWYCWGCPKVIYKFDGFSSDKPIVFTPPQICPIAEESLPPEWAVIHPEGYDSVYWTFKQGVPHLSCNGLRMARSDTHGWNEKLKQFRGMFPGGGWNDTEYDWPQYVHLKPPHIAVIDDAGCLPLSTQRYALQQNKIPFVDNLVRDTILSYIAFLLMHVPISFETARSFYLLHPLEEHHKDISWDTEFDLDMSRVSPNILTWVKTSLGMVPMDEWLFSLLKVERLLVCGMIWNSSQSVRRKSADGASNSKDINTDAVHSTILSDRNAIIDVPYWIAVGDSWKDIDEVFSSIAHGGIDNVIPDVSHSHLFASYCRPSSGCRNYEFGKSSLPSPSIDLEKVVQSMCQKTSQRLCREKYYLYAAEMIPAPAPCEPKSVLAKVWNECLGPRIIPFDQEKREALIAHASQHAELKRHIDAWQKINPGNLRLARYY